MLEACFFRNSRARRMRGSSLFLEKKAAINIWLGSRRQTPDICFWTVRIAPRKRFRGSTNAKQDQRPKRISPGFGYRARIKRAFFALRYVSSSDRNQLETDRCRQLIFVASGMKLPSFRLYGKANDIVRSLICGKKRLAGRIDNKISRSLAP